MGFFRRHKVVFIDALILFGLMLLFFSRWIFKERYGLFASDVTQDFSVHHFAAFAWRQGEIPLWDPYFTWALVGYLGSGIFYPFNLIMDFLHSFSIDNLNFGYLLMEANAFFHYFLASLFMYLLVRNFKISRFPALIAAVVFAYSGYLVKEYVHVQYLQGTVWLPLVFLLFYKSIFEEGKRIKYAVLTGLFFAVSLFPGQTQPAIYYVFLFLVFTLYATYHFYQNKERSHLLKPVTSLLVVALVSFGIFAIQFFPTREYIKDSARNEISYEYSTGYSTDPLYLLIHPFLPTFWGTMNGQFWDGVDEGKLDLITKTKWLDTFWGGLPNEMNFYIGLLPFFLLPFALFTKNKFLRDFFLILLFCSVLLMLSRSIPLVGRFYWYILGGIARVPVRAAVLWSFSLAFLAALGLQAILDFREEKREIFKKITNINFFILAALIFFFLPLLLVLMLSAAGSIKMPYFYFPMVNDFSLFIIYFLIYSLLFAFLVRTKEKLLLIVLTVFFVIELFSFHAGNSFLLGGPAPNDSLGKKNLPEIGYLKNDKDFFRVHGLGLTAYANNLFSLGYGTAGNFGVAYRPLMELYSLMTDYASPLYDLLNVKYFYTPNGKLNDLASSVLATSFTSKNQPANAFDDNPETEWAVDSTIQKKEEDWLGVIFRRPEVVIRIEFLGRDNDFDKEIKEAELNFSDGSSQKIALPAKKGWKAVAIKPTQTNWLKFIFHDFDLSGGENDSYGLKEVNIFNSKGERAQIGSPKFQKIGESNLFLNKSAFPRVFTTYSYRVFSTKDEMFTVMAKDMTGEEMRRSVFLYNRVIGFNNPGILPPVEPEASIREYKLKKVTIDVNMAADGFLVLSDPWFPGWKAFIDGRKTRLYQAYNVLRSVRVPQGRHEVVFSYEPLSFKVGLTISLVTIIVLLVYFSFPKLKKKRNNFRKITK